MQDGNTMRNNYGCDLDSLTTGSRIGMMRSASGDLHYYINGVDQGVACSGLPSGRKLYELEDLTEATHTTTTTSSKSATLSLCTSKPYILASAAFHSATELRWIMVKESD